MSPWWFDQWSRRVARSGRPILVGPWREEIGSEVLYWLPWIAQWCHTYKIAADRLVALSRGGAGQWYGAGTVIELMDYWPPEVFRLESQRDARQRGSVKQLVRTPLEEALYRTVAARLGLRRYHVLHPAQMYAQIRPWQQERMGLADVMRRLRFAPLKVPQLPLSVVLPERFVSVRFYARHTWPLTEEVRDYCGALVGAIAAHTPVVVVGSSAHMDDHLDAAFAGQNVTSLLDAFPLRENLAMQSAVIARSQAFVGTYGGTMQLAMRLGKPSAGFFLSFKGTAYAHNSLTEWLAIQQNLPIFIGTPAQGELVRSIVSVPLELPQPVGSSSGVMA